MDNTILNVAIPKLIDELGDVRAQPLYCARREGLAYEPTQPGVIGRVPEHQIITPRRELRRLGRQAREFLGGQHLTDLVAEALAAQNLQAEAVAADEQAARLGRRPARRPER